MTTTFTPEHLKRWTNPRCYVGARWRGWYVFLGQHRESDCLTRANFDAGWDRIKHLAESPIPDDCEDPGMSGFPHRNHTRDTDSIRKVCESNPLVGWGEWIAIHESNTAALEIADKIMGKLDGYPVVDETLWSEYEDTEAQQVWRNCYNPKERIAYIRKNRSQFDFDSFSQLLAVVRGKYFNGYASELIN